MVFSQEELDEKLININPRIERPCLINDVIGDDKIIEHIKMLDISKKAQRGLLNFNSTVKSLIEKGIPVHKNILIVANERSDDIKLVVMSILINNDLTDNCLYEGGSNNVCHEINGIFDYFMEDSSYLYGDSLEKAHNNFNEKYSIFNCCRGYYVEEIGASKYLFPFIIDDSHSSKEKKQMLKNLYKSFGVKVMDDVDTIGEEWGYFSLKRLAYKKLIDRIANKEKGKMKLSDICSTRRNSNEENEDAPPKNFSCSYSDIIGLENVKKQIKRMVAYMNKSKKTINLNHMAFLGNPGTGKTTMARCLAKELYTMEILEKDVFIETDRGGLIAKYVGQTAVKTRQVFQSAKGGMLFIDEAYTLFDGSDSNDFGKEAIATLIKEMEDNRDSTMVIFAGYTKEMKRMINSNPGLSSRIQFQIEFPDYSLLELIQIFEKMMKEFEFAVTDEAKDRLLNIFEKDRKIDGFANGRYIRNVIEKLILIQSERSEGFEITIEDVECYVSELPIVKNQKIGFC